MVQVEAELLIEARLEGEDDSPFCYTIEVAGSGQSHSPLHMDLAATEDTLGLV